MTVMVSAFIVNLIDVHRIGWFSILQNGLLFKKVD